MHIFSAKFENISIYAIFNDQSFNYTSLAMNNWAQTATALPVLLYR